MKTIFISRVSALFLALMINQAFAIPTTEREALVALYNSTGGGVLWGEFDTHTWLGAEGTECDWAGVHCENDHVITLRLSFGLMGSLPPELGLLTKLTSLDLGFGNNLTGNIPTELGQLTQLNELDLGGSQLIGEIPLELGLLTQLDKLNLDDNRLTGSIPPELGQLFQLTHLNLHGNKLSGQVPSELGQLTRLTYLRLSSNRLSGTISSTLFGQLATIESLFVMDNCLAVENPADVHLLLAQGENCGNILPSERDALIAFYHATKGDNWQNNYKWLSADGSECDWFGIVCDLNSHVTSIKLASNGISGAFPGEELSKLSQLAMLDLSFNQLSGSLSPSLGRLENLNELILADNQISGGIPPALGNMTNLITLNLISNQLTGEIPPELGKLSRLSNLGLGSNQLTGFIPPEVVYLAQMKKIDLSHNQLTGLIPLGLFFPKGGEFSFFKSLFLDDNQFTGQIPIDILIFPTSSGKIDLDSNCLSLDSPDQGKIDAHLSLVSSSSWKNQSKLDCPIFPKPDIVADYNVNTGLLTIKEVVFDGQRYYAELQNQGEFKFVLSKVTNISTPELVSPAFYRSSHFLQLKKSLILYIPEVSAFGKSYAVRMSHNPENNIFIITGTTEL